MFIFLCLSTLGVAFSSSITNPFGENGDIDKILPDYFEEDRKPLPKAYHRSKPDTLKDVKIIHEHSMCEIGFRFRWSASLGSSVYSSPIIFPSGPQGKKQIFQNTFYQYVEIVGYDGYKPWGWPLSFDDCSFQGSPILYDIDGDGTNDLGAIDKNGNMYWVRLNGFGKYLDDYHIQIPKLKIKKEWYKDLDPGVMDAYTMNSMFDHEHRHFGYRDNEENKDLKKGSKAKPDGLLIVDVHQDTYPGSKINKNTKASDAPSVSSRRRLVEEEASDHNETISSRSPTFSPSFIIDEGLDMNENETVLQPSFNYANRFDDDMPSRGAGDAYGDPNSTDVYKTFDDGYRYYSHLHNEYNESAFVFTDAHVLGSPVLFDIDKDGKAEVIVAISYYFDKAQYSNKEGLDFDPDMYIAGGLGCWDLEDQTWVWLVHLDLTTDKTKFKALIHSTPTVADLDGDGRYEVIVGTSLGLLYVVDADTGFVKRFFPMQFHEIQAQVAVADIVGGHNLEIIVADMGGNLVIVTLDGDVLWDKQLSGTLPHTPTIGDVDGDGQLDIVVVAVGDTGSHIWALRGDTGEILDGYPIALPLSSVASSSILLADLHTYDGELKNNAATSANRDVDPHSPIWTYNSEGHKFLTIDLYSDKVHTLSASEINKDRINAKPPKMKGLHLILATFDGHIYIIDGRTQCAERIDVGEHIYSTPLLDDVTGDGFLDLIVGTMSGQLIVLESSVPYHPLTAWSSFPRGRLNGFTVGQTGISVTMAERNRLKRYDMLADSKELSSRQITLKFDIFDTRAPPTNTDKDDMGSQRRYTVTFSKGTNKGHALYTHEYSAPGTYEVQLPVTPPEEMILVIGMTTDKGLYFEDAFPVAVGTKFYVWIKYFVATPIVILCIPLILYTQRS